MTPQEREDADLELALAVSDTIDPGWEDRLPADAWILAGGRPPALAGLAALERALLEAELAGDDAQVAQLEALAVAEADRLGERPPPLVGPTRLTIFDCPALVAWRRRGDTVTTDALWKAAAYEQQALELSADGCHDAARDALALAQTIMRMAGTPAPTVPDAAPASEAEAFRRLGQAIARKQGDRATSWPRATRGAWG